jgi:hypothetical protein
MPHDTTRRTFTVLLLAGLFGLSLAACDVSKNADGSTHIVMGTDALHSSRTAGGVTGQASAGEYEYPKIVGLNYLTQADAQTVATRLMQARSKDGMAGVIADISGCYAAAQALLGRGRSYPGSLQFCMVYDATAYKIDLTVSQRHGLPRTPYFEVERANRRWRSNANNIGEAQDRVSVFLQKATDMVQPYIPANVYLTSHP